MLPKQTLCLLDRVAEKGDRSHLINEAIRFYIRKVGGEKLRQRLKEGAFIRAQRDVELAEEWFALEHEP